LEVEVRAAKAVKAAVVETEAVEAKAAKVAEVEGCIGGGGMHWKCTEADGSDRAGSEDKVSDAVKRSELVRTH
jgi:hypothetical protein